MGPKKIAIIGGGSSGLTSIKACLDEGLEVTCYELQDDIGGLWRFHENDKDGIASVMGSTVINTSKEMSAFSDFPPPADFPNHMHNSKMIRYIELYAENFDLKNYIQFRHKILSVNQTEDYQTTGRFVVRVLDINNSLEKELIYDGVMVCTGHHVFPNVPKFQGQDSFQGEILHSHSYKKPRGFENKNVVVVGIGNSGADLAVELSPIAKKLYLSTRRGAWILPLIGPGGYPNDAYLLKRNVHILRGLLPEWVNTRFMEFLINQKFDHTLYNLKPKHPVLGQHPTVNDVLPTKIINGTVVLKSDIDHLTPKGVAFVGEEDTEYECDTVILATGYLIKFPYLSKEIFNPVDNECRLYKLMFPSHLKHASLVFIGLSQPAGCIFPIADNQARWYAQLMTGKVKVSSPELMEKEIQRYANDTSNRFYSSYRHTIQVDWLPYMDDIASQYGAKPNLLKLALTDPRLFWACLTGPCLPYQFRIHGPGKWAGARDAILTYQQRVRVAFNTRIHKEEKQGSKCKTHGMAKIMAVGVVAVTIWVLADRKGYCVGFKNAIFSTRMQCLNWARSGLTRVPSALRV